jgi:hypothetical protein
MTRDTSPPTSPRMRLRKPQAALPSAAELAALGTVLCVYTRRHGGELGGWAQAASAEVRCGIDSDGWHECLQFRDGSGNCCWRLYLLPDSDFLAWERIQQRLPAAETWQAPDEAVASRLWRRLSTRVGGEAWQTSIVRLHALRHPRPFLAASSAPLSRLGAEMLLRVARIEGLDAFPRVDDCCCRPCADGHDGPAPVSHANVSHANPRTDP